MPPARDPPVVAAGSTSGTLQPRNRPAGCTAGTRAARRRSSPPRPRPRCRATPGTRRHDRLDDDERGELAAGEHVVADRDLAVDEVRRRSAGRRPRSGRRAARSRPALAASSAAQRWSKRATRRARADRAAAAGRPLDGGEDRLGREHHPRPAAEGRVVDACGGRRRRRRAGRGRARSSSRSRSRPRPTMLVVAVGLDELGEDREDLDPKRRGRRRWPRAVSSLEEPVGDLDDDRPVVELDDEAQRHEVRRRRATSRSLAGLASTAVTVPR